jgi:hypothetical protein
MPPRPPSGPPAHRVTQSGPGKVIRRFVAAGLVAVLVLVGLPGRVEAFEAASKCANGTHFRDRCVWLDFRHSPEVQASAQADIRERTSATRVRVIRVQVQVLRPNGTWRTLTVRQDNDGWHARYDTASTAWTNTLCGAIYRARARFAWQNNNAGVNRGKWVVTRPTVFRC